MKGFRKILLISGIGLLVSLTSIFLVLWPKLRWLQEFELDKYSFDENIMTVVEGVSGLDFPPEARGIRFHYFPPIDPNYIAEIEIPKEELPELLDQIEGMSETTTWPSIQWGSRFRWPPTVLPANLILTKRIIQDGYYLELFLEDRGETFGLYVHSFTL